MLVSCYVVVLYVPYESTGFRIKIKGGVIALSDTKLRNLTPADKPFQEADDGGLFIEVMPSGSKV